MKTWLTVAEGAEYSGVSRDTIYGMRAPGAPTCARRRTKGHSLEAGVDRCLA